MVKRKSSRHQSWRQKKIQQEKQARANKSFENAEDILNSSKLGPKQQGRIVAHYGANFAVQDDQMKVHFCLTRRNLPKLACGDYVQWQIVSKNEGIIVALNERLTLLSRPDYQNQLKAMAANIDQILVVIAVKPTIDEDLLNRYLIAAKLTAIQPVIVLNKTDLLSTGELKALDEDFIAEYKSLGYTTIHASTKLRSGMKELLLSIKSKTSIFVGQSGVGKSSLIKSILPSADIRIGELSHASGLGKHTTTVSMLYNLDHNSSIIDSPGIREFGLGHISLSQVAEGFEEFGPFLQNCKFNDCTHHHEPGCAVINGVQIGAIPRRRYKSFLRIAASLSRRKT